MIVSKLHLRVDRFVKQIAGKYRRNYAMGRRPKSSKKKSKNSNNKSKSENYPPVVGPDLFLLLQGQLFGSEDGSRGGDGAKNVALVLCGETHEDAVDVTRRSPPGQVRACVKKRCSFRLLLDYYSASFD